MDKDIIHEMPVDDIVVEFDLRPLFHVLTIIGGSVVASIVYGILHDLVTAHVCVEYFTVAHTRIVDTENPVVLALVWGVVTTWWMGLGLGVLLAIACRAGKKPKRTFRDVAPAIGKLLAVMAGCAVVAGLTGYLLTKGGMFMLPGFFPKLLPPEMHARFAADLWAHSASYASGAIGGLIVIWRVWRGRRT